MPAPCSPPWLVRLACLEPLQGCFSALSAMPSQSHFHINFVSESNDTYLFVHMVTVGAFLELVLFVHSYITKADKIA